MDRLDASQQNRICERNHLRWQIRHSLSEPLYVRAIKRMKIACSQVASGVPSGIAYGTLMYAPLLAEPVALVRWAATAPHGAAALAVEGASRVSRSARINVPRKTPSLI